ncbi:MAG: response regulator transcription factor [Opitutaceae bacterium]|nr:response regulator transcription factor [Opitutaceae bacterium]
MILLEHSATGPALAGEDISHPDPKSRATSFDHVVRSKCQGDPVTVLLAEERATVRRAFCANFRPADGIVVVGQADDSSQVLGSVERLQPDVVVIAVKMALRLGLETLSRTLKARWGSDLVVLLPNRESPFVMHVAASGAAGYLSEQDSAGQMTATICQAHDHADGRRCGVGRLQGTSRLFLTDDPACGKETMHLSTREREVLHWVAEGNANKQIAARLSLSIKTIEKHRQNLMDKLGIHETATLTRYALYAGIVQ